MLLNNYKDIDEILKCDNIVHNIDNPDFSQSAILIKSLPYCVSIHDLHGCYTKDDVSDFIAKYKRRLCRIIDYINSDKKIFFLHSGIEINDDEKNMFFQAIKAINPLCTFYLIDITLTKNIDSITQSDNFMKVNRKTPDVYNDWTTSYIDWNKIFMDIEQSYGK
jgi:hypothetical protein